MPIISKQACGLQADGSTYWRIVKVDSAGNFSCELPKHMAEVLGYATVGGASLDELTRMENKAKDDFTNATRKTRKVILYVNKVTAYMYKPGLEEEKHVSFHVEDISFVDTQAVEFAACVANEIETKVGVSLQYEYELIPSTIPASTANALMCRSARRGKYTAQMDWTQEREDFFAGLARGMEHLIRALHAMNQTGMAQIADNPNALKQLGFGK